jgi:hypothetical protein
MRDAIDIIGLEVVYKGSTTKIHAIQFVPKSGSIYITLKQENNVYMNIPYKEIYKLIKQQIIRL